MNWQERASAAGNFSWLPFPRPQRGGCCWQGSARGCLDGAGAQAVEQAHIVSWEPSISRGLGSGFEQLPHWETQGAALGAAGICRAGV